MDDIKKVRISEEENLQHKFGTEPLNGKPNYKKEFIRWLLWIILLLFIALLTKAYVFEWVLVDGSSMENTLEDHQTLFVNKLAYVKETPKAGDIVVVRMIFSDEESIIAHIPVLRDALPKKNEQKLIKRVIAVEGDVLDFKNGVVFVNGKKLDEPYIKGYTKEPRTLLPIKIGAGEVYLLGDNRENSKDSRVLGVFSTKDIVGVATFRIAPIKRFGWIYSSIYKF
jgi:signal peptidase I